MNYIFLDVDGVLNSNRYMMKRYKIWKKYNDQNKDWPLKYEKMKFIDKKAIRILAKIVKKSKAKVVLSSSWRYGFQNKSPEELDTQCRALYDALAKHNIYFAGLTNPYHDGYRALQIKDYIDEFLTKDDSFVIIDDELHTIHEVFPYNFIHTEFEYGLQKKHIKQALQILRGKNESDL